MEHGQKIPGNKDDEGFITKTLGVLQEDGPYAMFLFLKEGENKSRTKEIAGGCSKSLIDLLNNNEIKGALGISPI